MNDSKKTLAALLRNSAAQRALPSVTPTLVQHVQAARRTAPQRGSAKMWAAAALLAVALFPVLGNFGAGSASASAHNVAISTAESARGTGISYPDFSFVSLWLDEEQNPLNTLDAEAKLLAASVLEWEGLVKELPGLSLASR